MSERKGWLFKYKGSTVGAAVTQKLNYHKKRIEFWTSEREIAKAALKEKGCELREYEVTGGTQINFIADPALANRHSQCQSRIRFHESKVEEFSPWGTVLNANPKQTLDLDHEDIMYFGVAGAQEED